MKKDLDYCIGLPYRIEIQPIPEEECGGFMARLPQFGELGIIGDGETETHEGPLPKLETVRVAESTPFGCGALRR